MAVTVTLTLSDAIAARLATAFGKELGLMDETDPENPVPRDATMVEFKTKLGGMALQILKRQEHQALVDEIVVPDATIG